MDKQTPRFFRESQHTRSQTAPPYPTHKTHTNEKVDLEGARNNEPLKLAVRGLR